MAKNLTLDEIEHLGELLASFPEPFMPMEADMLDGYLTAIALLKHPPEINDWLPLVFDVNGNTRAKLSDAEEQAQLRKLVLARGAEIESLLLAQKPIDPIIYDEDEDEGDEFAALRPFADGFAFACANWPELLMSPSKPVQAALVGILRYESEGGEADAETDAEAREMLQDIDEEVAFANLDEALADVAACVQEIAEITRAEDIARAAKPARKLARRR